MSAMAVPDLILVNLGTPDAPTPDGVRRFLKEFLSDPMVVDLPRWLWKPLLNGLILNTRPKRVARMYAEIWTPQGSPLDRDSRRVALALEDALRGRARVHLAYRYGKPSLAELLRERIAAGSDSIVVIPLFPHPTAATTGTMKAVVQDVAGEDPRVQVEVPACDHPDYIEALRDRCLETFAPLAAPPEHLLLSFHGLPKRVDRQEGGRYSRSCRRTAEALLAALDWDQAAATLCYQSRFGSEAWLEPATAKLLSRLPGQGIRRLGVVCPGFLTDGLETLFEIGVEGRRQFEQAGGQNLSLVPAVADHPALIRALSSINLPA